MKIFFLNYGHFESYSQANAAMKKNFPNGTIFSDGNGKYTIRVFSSPNDSLFRSYTERDPRYWISENDFLLKK